MRQQDIVLPITGTVTTTLSAQGTANQVAFYSDLTADNVKKATKLTITNPKQASQGTYNRRSIKLVLPEEILVDGVSVGTRLYLFEGTFSVPQGSTLVGRTNLSAAARNIMADGTVVNMVTHEDNVIA